MGHSDHRADVRVMWVEAVLWVAGLHATLRACTEPMVRWSSRDNKHGWRARVCGPGYSHAGGTPGKDVAAGVAPAGWTGRTALAQRCAYGFAGSYAPAKGV